MDLIADVEIRPGNKVAIIQREEQEVRNSQILEGSRNMLAQIKTYVVCLISILVIDYLWINVLMKSFYVEQLRSIGRISPDGKFQPELWAAIAVYLILALAIVQFALPKLPAAATWYASFETGALLGFVIYAVYDLTNYSTLKDYALILTFVDMAWGTFLGGVTTMIAKIIRDAYIIS